MVGVPGKSKGCSTCRRRKKGCDQKRPICGQCASSGYVCGGYQRDLTFIAHPTSKTVEKATFVPVHPAPPVANPSASLDQSAIIAQCRSLFFQVFMPHGRCLCTDKTITDWGHPVNWVELIPQLPTDEPSLDLAFSALSISRVGRSQGDLGLVKESSKFYGSALKSLQAALAHPQRVRSDGTLAACLLLAYYETFENVGGKSVGWASHVQGASRVMELRGPEEHSTGPAHFIFIGSRILTLYSALLRRRQTFLANKDWLQVPWGTPSYRTGVDDLLSVAVNIPDLLELSDKLAAVSQFTNKGSALVDLLNRCLAVQKSLDVWLTCRKENAAPIVTRHQREDEDDNYPFTYDITFDNHLFFNANLAYWCSSLVIGGTVLKLSGLIGEVGIVVDNNTSRAIAATDELAREAAVNIAQSVPYGLWPEMGDLGISHITFPMGLIYKYFSQEGDTVICSWLEKISQGSKHLGLNVSRMHENVSAFNIDNEYDERVLPYEFETALRVASPGPAGWDLPSRSAPVSPGRKQSHTSSISEDNNNDEEAAPAGSDPDSDGWQSSSQSSNKHTGGRGGAGAVPRHLAELQRINANRGEFTFVEEDPSSHYIVSSTGKPSIRKPR